VVASDSGTPLNSGSIKCARAGSPIQAERQRRDRDAKLGRCKVGVEILNGVLEGGGVGPACADQLCYTATTDSNEGKFSRDEEAVRDDESKYGEYPDQIEHTSIGTRHGLLSGGHRQSRSQ